MKEHSHSEPFTPENKTHARVLFWIGVFMCVPCIMAVAAAEAFMPDNAGGEKGIVTFYRVFGTLLIIESAFVGWAYGHVKRTV